MSLFAIGMLPRGLGRVVQLGLVMRDGDQLFCAVKGPLPRRMNMVMRQSVTMTRITRLPVSVAARRRHVVFSMGFHLLPFAVLEGRSGHVWVRAISVSENSSLIRPLLRAAPMTFLTDGRP